MEQLKKQLPLSPFREIELYCQLTNQIWFVEAGVAAGGPGGGTVRIMPERRWLERQLANPVQLSFTNAPLDQVVAELSHASGIRFTPEPGLYQAVPLITLNSNNASVRQTLETLSGSARIAFDLKDDSIFLRLAGSPTSAPATPPVGPVRGEPIVARIAVPVSNGLSMDVFIHESDLSPELNELRKRKIAEALEALQRTWNPAAPVPPVPPESHAPASTENK